MRASVSRERQRCSGAAVQWKGRAELEHEKQHEDECGCLLARNLRWRRDGGKAWLAGAAEESEKQWVQACCVGVGASGYCLKTAVECGSVVILFEVGLRVGVDVDVVV